MPKLTLTVAPTFKATVRIPTAGGDPVSLEFTFRHRTRAELKRFLEETQGEDKKDDVHAVMAMATGWELSDPFNEESLGVLCENYVAAPHLIFEKYLDELTKAREKN
jgi:hypothetical protein